MSSMTREAPTDVRGSVTFLDQTLWRALDADAPDAEFAAAWLTLQCRLLSRVERGVLVLREAGGKLAPVGRWPEGDGGSIMLAKAAEMAVTHGKGVALPASAEGSRTDALAYPILIDGSIEGVAALECTAAGEGPLRETMRQLQWGLASVEAMLRRRAVKNQTAYFEASVAALDIAASTLATERFDDGARTLATELANRLGASRVAVGWHRRGAVRVVALSHALAFTRKMDAIRKIATAMEEAIDQERTIAYPLPEGASPLGTSAHAALSAAQDGAAALTVPMTVGQRIVGAVLLEWPSASGCTQESVTLAEAVASLVAPILIAFHRAERWLLLQLWDRLQQQAMRLLGPAHFGLKLATAAVVAIVGFFSIYTTEYRVGARATVEGETRRTIAAALDGYVASEHARAGQVVHKGDLLATLDGSELILQRLRWIATREQRRLELDKAVAGGQRADVNINQAQINEATAQIALLDEQIGRTKIVAPFDALILSGDLSQSVGAAVQRTQVLFEIAPLNAYRVIAHVPDSEIDRVTSGQHGVLVLTALPDDRYEFDVKSVTPEAEVVDGVNSFRVEARLDGPSHRLRPNMEGVAKISVGEHHLIWIWTHRLIAAVRLWLWSWWP
ncbi:MAG TPA: HlyD family efflux transporter periplasmic adaptor subunit [Stellaceae bacterium]|nr:HlyD family efflux transporter periplasmic adaptor subunit [Stellaceae bacterium]